MNVYFHKFKFALKFIKLAIYYIPICTNTISATGKTQVVKPCLHVPSTSPILRAAPSIFFYVSSTTGLNLFVNGTVKVRVNEAFTDIFVMVVKESDELCDEI